MRKCFCKTKSTNSKEKMKFLNLSWNMKNKDLNNQKKLL